jgi:hypothetical protein
LSELVGAGTRAQSGGTRPRDWGSGLSEDKGQGFRSSGDCRWRAGVAWRGDRRE